MDFDPRGTRLPIKVDCATNGEFAPQPLTRLQLAANAHAHQLVGAAAKKTGLGRRGFLKTLMGSAATLLAFNQVYARGGVTGGSFAIPAEAAYDSGIAHSVLGGDEFIFDIQNHCVDPSGSWTQGADGKRWERVLNQVFAQRRKCDAGGYACYSAEQLVKEVFLDSDTRVAVVSALWGSRGSNPTPIEYAARARDIIDSLGGRHRALIHGGVLPNEPGALAFMDVQAREFNVAAWKTYPQWGPDGTGYWMDDEQYGIPFIEKARELGVKVICAHRGIPLGGLDYRYSHPADIARVAHRFPDVTFICYHSGFEPGVTEGPYDPDADKGVDRLIKAHQDNGFKPNSGNLYAELGSTWRACMSSPDQAAHLLGKLLHYFGEERICWGTDSLWYGSPQDQIQALRSFEISSAMQKQYDYPPFTARARRRIFGLNAAEAYGLDVDELLHATHHDTLAKLKAEYRNNLNPSFQTFGPKTRREFLRLQSPDGRPA
ncbi:MAG: amidohydrolase family protein [Gammaproteobacteria bacterium]